MDINSQEFQKSFYMPFMNRDEIYRIFNVRDGDDYLLKLRADTVVDNMRLFRVYRNKAINYGEGWSFEKSFHTKPYDMFLNSLDEDIRVKCAGLTYGNIFSNDANGYIMNSEYGPIITVSDSLGYFFKFMNFALCDHGEEVPYYVRMNAIRIAIRVMLQVETLDFLMDPRGIVTKKMMYSMHLPINYQLMTIVGHEFSHYILEHLDESNCKEKILYKSTASDVPNDINIKIFSQSQQEELDADLLSLKLPNFNEDEYARLFDATLLWFSSLSLYEAVEELMFPAPSWKPSSHPSAEERIDNIIRNGRLPKNFNNAEFIESRELGQYFKEYLIKDVTINTEIYEFYGSLYLDKPNTKWRGKQLVDRRDYY